MWLRLHPTNNAFDCLQDQYHFSEVVIGLIYLGLGLGIAFAVLMGIFTLGRIMRAHEAAGRPMLPEHRLPILVVGSMAIVTGLFLYGWSAEARVFWIVPIIGTAFVESGIICAQISINTYLVDAFPSHSASAMATLGILRSFAAAALPLMGPPMYKALGLGWGNSVLGFVAALGIPTSLFLMRYGEGIRKGSKLNENVE